MIQELLYYYTSFAWFLISETAFFSFFFSFAAVFPFSSFLFFPRKRFGFCCDWAGRFENYLHRGNLFLFLSISICPKSKIRLHCGNFMRLKSERMDIREAMLLCVCGRKSS